MYTQIVRKYKDQIWLICNSKHFVASASACVIALAQATAGEISSDLYGLSGCDILNLTFCRLDFHQLLIKIS